MTYNHPIIVVSGPSAVGKNTLINDVVARGLCQFFVPFTSRSPRQDEIPGREYQFLPEAVFHDGIKNRFFLDWDYALGNYYGHSHQLLAPSSKPLITHSLSRMALRLREKSSRIMLVFLYPKSIQEIKSRLIARDEDESVVQGRIMHGMEELLHSPLFDHVIPVNGGLEAMEVLMSNWSHWFG